MPAETLAPVNGPVRLEIVDDEGQRFTQVLDRYLVFCPAGLCVKVEVDKAMSRIVTRDWVPFTVPHRLILDNV
jgi:hypothetical protein